MLDRFISAKEPGRKEALDLAVVSGVFEESVEDEHLHFVGIEGRTLEDDDPHSSTFVSTRRPVRVLTYSVECRGSAATVSLIR